MCDRFPNTVSRSFLCMPRTLFGNSPSGTLIGYRSRDFLDSPNFLYLSRSTACSHFHTPQNSSQAALNMGVWLLCASFLSHKMDRGQKSSFRRENWESWCAWMCFEPHLMGWAATFRDTGLFLPQTIRLLIRSTNNDHMVQDRCCSECWESGALNWQKFPGFLKTTFYGCWGKEINKTINKIK